MPKQPSSENGASTSDPKPELAATGAHVPTDSGQQLSVPLAQGALVDKEMVRGFFIELLPGLFGESGRLKYPIVIFDKQTWWTIWCFNLDSAVSLACSIASEGHDAYYHVALHDFDLRTQLAIEDAQRKGKTKPFIVNLRNLRGTVFTKFRGRKDTAQHLSFLWLDVDYGETGHEKKNLPPTKEAALELIRRIGRKLGMKPSWIIHTGHGFHVYWIFVEPLSLENDEERASATALTKAFELFAAGVATELGIEQTGSPYELDAVHDLARILRIPGTFNCKDPKNPLPVYFEEKNDVRYSVDDFATHPALQEHLIKARSNTKVRAKRSTLTINPQEILADERRCAGVQGMLDSLAARSEWFYSLLEHEADDWIAESQQARGNPVDTSGSNYDYRIARFLHGQGWLEDSALVALQLHNRKWGRSKSDDYFVRTIERVWSEDEVQAQHQAPVAPALSECESASKIDSEEVTSAGQIQECTDDVVQAEDDAGRYQASTTDVAKTAEPQAESLFSAWGLPEDSAPLKSIEEARAEVAVAASTWNPSKQSCVISGSTGVGKTTALARRMLSGLSSRAVGFKSGIGVFCLETRELAKEKAEKFRELVAGDESPPEVLVILGRSPNPESGWWCAASELSQLMSELRRPSCKICPLLEICRAEPGRFLFERKQVLSRMAGAKSKDEGPVLVVTTSTNLRYLWAELPKRTPVVIDDTDGLFLLTSRFRFRLVDVQKAVADAEAWLGENGSTLEADEKRVAQFESCHEERQTAWERLKADLKAANTVVDASSAARAWMLACGGTEGDQVHAIQRVQKHWRPQDMGKVVGSLNVLRRRFDAVPFTVVAKLVVTVLDAFWRMKLGAEESRVATALRQLPSFYLDLVVRGRCLSPNNGRDHWPWEIWTLEDGGDGSPCYTKLAVEIARETHRGQTPVIGRTAYAARTTGAGECEIFLPDHEHVARALKGRICWTGVSIMPPLILEALSARQETILVTPPNLCVVVPSRTRGNGGDSEGRFWGFGPGKRKQDAPSTADSLVRDIFKACADKFAGGELTIRGQVIQKKGGVLHKLDYEALGGPEGLHYYGRDHASTDSLAGCELSLVRRCVPSFRHFETEARALRQALALCRSGLEGTTTKEDRSWDGSLEVIETTVMQDPLERGIHEFYEQHLQLNALGRCRPFANPDRLHFMILLAGFPFPGVVARTVILEDLLEELGIDASKITIPSVEGFKAARKQLKKIRKAKAAKRQGGIIEILDSCGPVSQRQLAAELDVSPATVRRDLADMGLYEGVTGKIHSHCALILLRDSMTITCRSIRLLPSTLVAADIADHATGKHPKERTVRGLLRQIAAHLNDGAPLLPKRSDRASNMLMVLDSLDRLLKSERAHG